MPPPETALLWQWYLDISASRTFSAFGHPHPLLHSEMLAWAILNGVTLEPWCLRTIKLLDREHTAVLMRKDAPTLEELMGTDD